MKILINYVLQIFFVLVVLMSCKEEQTPVNSTESPISEEISTPEKTVHQEYIPLKEKHAGHYKSAPNGKFIMYSSENAQGIKLYDVAQKSTRIVSENGMGFDAAWSSNETIIFKEKGADYTVQLKKFDLNTNTTTVLTEPASLLPISYGKDTQFFLNKKPITLAIKKQNTAPIIIPANQAVYAPLVNYKNQLVLVHEGTNMKLFNFEGQLLEDLGAGLATSWSPNGNVLLYFIDQSNDGHEISSSSLYSYNVKTNNTKVVLNDANIIAAYPYFLNDTTIIYTDLKTHKQAILPYE